MAIPTRTLGRTGMRVTEVSLGGVTFGGLHGPVPEAEAATAPERAYADRKSTRLNSSHT